MVWMLLNSQEKVILGLLNVLESWQSKKPSPEFLCQMRTVVSGPSFPAFGRTQPAFQVCPWYS